MRVIAGSARGLKLECLPGEEIRPTLDRVREGIFSSLTPFLPDSRVLDLFGGTGALGIEALSRGAASAWFLDASPKACRLIRENLRYCRLEAAARVQEADALTWLKERADTAEPFDLIFADPPYEAGYYPGILTEIARGGLLKEEGILVVEHKRKLALPHTPEGLWIFKEKSYGDVGVTYYKRKN